MSPYVPQIGQKGELSMKRLLLLGLILAVVVSACSFTEAENQELDDKEQLIVVYAEST
jgi:hypothetical protein